MAIMRLIAIKYFNRLTALINIFSWQLYSYISDDLFLEGALFDTQRQCDVSLKITSVIKQKIIISKNWTGLNGLLQNNYCMQWNINVIVIWWWMWWISGQWSKYWFWSYWKQSFWEYGGDREYEPVKVPNDDSVGKTICSNWTLPSFKR